MDNKLISDLQRHKNVWIDSDATNFDSFDPDDEKDRSKHAITSHPPDQDDGWAILACLNSKDCNVIGISSTYGNDFEEFTYESLNKIIHLYYGDKRPFEISRGATEPLKSFQGYDSFIKNSQKRLITQETNATKEMYDKFMSLGDNEKVCILAIGPLTNIATLLLFHPDVTSKIKCIVGCDGRKNINTPFYVGTKQKENGLSMGDLNFDLDPRAAQIVIQYNIPFILAGFNIGTYAWLYHHDLIKLHSESNSKDQPLLHKLSDPSLYKDWLNFWEENFGNQLPPWEDKKIHGFHPFDLMTASVLYGAEHLTFEPANITFPVAKSDRAKPPSEKKEKEKEKDVDKEKKTIKNACHFFNAIYHKKHGHSKAEESKDNNGGNGDDMDGGGYFEYYMCGAQHAQGHVQGALNSNLEEKTKENGGEEKVVCVLNEFKTQASNNMFVAGIADKDKFKEFLLDLLKMKQSKRN